MIKCSTYLVLLFLLSVTYLAGASNNVLSKRVPLAQIAPQLLVNLVDPSYDNEDRWYDCSGSPSHNRSQRFVKLRLQYDKLKELNSIATPWRLEVTCSVSAHYRVFYCAGSGPVYDQSTAATTRTLVISGGTGSDVYEAIETFNFRPNDGYDIFDATYSITSVKAYVNNTLVPNTNSLPQNISLDLMIETTPYYTSNFYNKDTIESVTYNAAKSTIMWPTFEGALAYDVEYVYTETNQQPSRNQYGKGCSPTVTGPTSIIHLVT